MIRPLILAVLLTGCTAVPVVAERVTAPAVALQCSAECRSTCLPATWPQWTGDPASPPTWDNVYPDVANPLKEIAKTCEAARASCVACIARIETVGIGCGVTRPCAEVTP